MDSLPYLCRFQYGETAEYLTSLTDPLIAAYQNYGGSAAGQDLKQLEMLEGQLTWLVHIIGAVVRGRINTTGEPTPDLGVWLGAKCCLLIAFWSWGVGALPCHHALPSAPWLLPG